MYDKEPREREREYFGFVQRIIFAAIPKCVLTVKFTYENTVQDEKNSIFYILATDVSSS